MEEKVKEIVARYTKLPADQIQPGTLIDRSAVASSIILHRMYASLAAAGIVVENYWDIKTFGALMQQLGGNAQPDTATGITRQTDSYQWPEETNGASIGIDIEQINLLPKTADYREDHFYTSNFSPSEIAYCILQADPVASFAGLFAAKEAIVKADNNYLESNFNNINIDHLPGGKPVHAQFAISITHTADVAVAVAVRLPRRNIPSPLSSALPHSKRPFLLLAFSALILSLAALLLVLFFHQ